MSSSNPIRWRIKKERVFLKPGRYWSHPAWSLYFGTARVARYLRWSRCIEHIQAYYDKFGATR